MDPPTVIEADAEAAFRRDLCALRERMRREEEALTWWASVRQSLISLVRRESGGAVRGWR